MPLQKERKKNMFNAQNHNFHFGLLNFWTGYCCYSSAPNWKKNNNKKVPQANLFGRSLFFITPRLKWGNECFVHSLVKFGNLIIFDWFDLHVFRLQYNGDSFRLIFNRNVSKEIFNSFLLVYFSDCCSISTRLWIKDILCDKFKSITESWLPILRRLKVKWIRICVHETSVLINKYRFGILTSYIMTFITTYLFSVEKVTFSSYPYMDDVQTFVRRHQCKGNFQIVSSTK